MRNYAWNYRKSTKQLYIRIHTLYIMLQLNIGWLDTPQWVKWIRQPSGLTETKW